MTMNNYPTWVGKYIDLKSQIDNIETDVSIATSLNISRENIYAFKRRHPDVDEIISDRLKLQYSKLGNRALLRLYELVKGTSNPKLIQLALEIGMHYTQKTDITNRYDNMDKREVVKDLLNHIKRLK